jgi:hypothetical protein
MSSVVTNIVSFEENAPLDKLNDETFDPVNYLTLGSFDFDNYSWTLREVHDGQRDVQVYKRIGLGDYVCSCGETVYDDNLVSEHRGALSRLYIPRVMTNALNFYSDEHVKQYIFEQLSPFCNIRDIQLRWLPDVYDLSAFVYLDHVSPICLTPLGKTAICNLTCHKCHSNRVHVSQTAFWNLLPSESIGFICL